MRKKILVVDDDELLRRIYKAMLSGEFEVIEAVNGKEGVEKYISHLPDLVLMDIKMPVMDGITATKEIKRINPDAVVVGVTAYAPELGEDTLSAGAKTVIPKPLKREEFVEMIKKLLKS
jgi:CheY-like chemotaxis protein